LSELREYHLDTLLGRGDTSEVWAASNLGPAGFAVPVAVKTLSAHCARSPEHVRAFLNEARAVSYVHHPNVVKTHALVGENERYWLVMELVRGWTMRALLAAIEVARKGIPFRLALALARDACAGVQAIHAAGLVHRNLTPDNLMIATVGHLVVLDFGCASWQLAERVHFTPPAAALDRGYASPEILDGLPVDERTDVYSLGALLRRLVPPGPDVPFPLESIIQRALDPDPAQRLASVRQLEIALELVTFREGWMVTPSYVAAYLSDVLRGSPLPALPRAPAEKPPRVAAPAPAHMPAAPEAPLTLPPDEPVTAARAARRSRSDSLPPSRRLVGAGARASESPRRPPSQLGKTRIRLVRG
jgi:eukaryotic-like serine/threonine-protein kinase